MKILLTFLVLIISSCAISIPDQSIVLNQQVGESIRVLRQSHISLVSVFFDSKVEEINKLAKIAITDYSNNLSAGVAQSAEKITFDVKTIHGIVSTGTSKCTGCGHFKVYHPV